MRFQKPGHYGGKEKTGCRGRLCVNRVIPADLNPVFTSGDAKVLRGRHE